MSDWELPRLPIHRGQSAPPEDSPYTDVIVSEFESSQGHPYTAERLGFKDNFNLNPFVEMKVRAIDEHILNVIRDEGLRDSPIGYKTVLDRMLANLGQSLESLSRGKQLQALDSLFSQVSVANRQSSKTFLKTFEKGYNTRKVASLKQQLKDALATLK